ncbi:flagellar hook assembly protein FlgD [Virgibacillus sediminis]|uniref:Flagellar hook assembly protein FlgD n=1 Tax=Virgibacillus sediminis TaxID=202260 RepID=A0ABV7ABL5_9BACI
MPTIDPSLYLSNQQTVRTPSSELGKDQFLQILMTQLQNQDPSNPMDDREFISQMAQFTSLEQTMNMANSIERLVESQLISPVIQYSHMAGMNVTYEGENGAEQSGTVAAVSQKDGYAILELENGEKVYADAVLQVSNPAK